MKANELRIGNYIEASVPFNADSITYFQNSLIQEIGEVYVKLQNKLIPYEYVKPILITEEYLIELGLVKNLYSDRLSRRFNLPDDSFVIHLQEDGKHTISFEGNTLTYVKHVHQLQNLYFALTGEELTTKE